MTLSFILGYRSSCNILPICPMSFAKKREICKRADTLLSCASLGITPANVVEIYLCGFMYIRSINLGYYR